MKRNGYFTFQTIIVLISTCKWTNIAPSLSGKIETVKLRPFHTWNTLNAHWTTFRLEANQICINQFHTHMHEVNSIHINIACVKLKWHQTTSSPTSYVRVSSLFSTKEVQWHIVWRWETGAVLKETCIFNMVIPDRLICLITSTCHLPGPITLLL